jgi:transposase
MASSPVPIVLSAVDYRELENWCRPSSQCRQRLRASIVLAAADGQPNQQIAADLATSRVTVRQWRGRWAREGIAGLSDQPRSGRPATFTPIEVAQVKAIACSDPDDKGLPLARWFVGEIVGQAIAEHVVDRIGRTTIGRWLAHDAIKPWQTRSWITPRDPGFAVKAAVVLDLYQHQWDGQPLGDHDYVISADEKPGIQALRRTRTHPGLLPGRPRRVEFDYHRGGTLAYLAALDVTTGTITGITRAKTGITPFGELVDTVMSQEPYRSAHRVFWIVDNGSSHKPGWAQTRVGQRWPNVTMVHTPVHASWLNQIEVYFSIVSRKALNGLSFNNTDALAKHINQFQTWYNTTSHPFNWHWTRRELNNYLTRLGLAA